ncbi:hypothetical protein OROGR_000872 [Orobanche gracilis]
MAFSSRRIILIALISMIAISPSLGRKEKESSSEMEKYLRDLCSKTNETKECWAIIKRDLTKFNDTDPRKVADTIIVLAKTKGEEIHEELDRLFEGSRDDQLKYKYGLCSKNYSDAIRDLYFARRDLELSDDRNIPIQIDDALEELTSCGVRFGKDSFDPAHIRNRNKEFGVYVQIVKAATERLQLMKN